MSYGGKEYLVIVDEFSQFPEAMSLQSTTSGAVILKLKTFRQICSPRRFEVRQWTPIRVGRIPPFRERVGIHPHHQ